MSDPLGRIAAAARARTLGAADELRRRLATVPESDDSVEGWEERDRERSDTARSRWGDEFETAGDRLLAEVIAHAVFRHRRQGRDGDADRLQRLAPQRGGGVPEAARQRLESLLARFLLDNADLVDELRYAGVTLECIAHGFSEGEMALDRSWPDGSLERLDESIGALERCMEDSDVQHPAEYGLVIRDDGRIGLERLSAPPGAPRADSP